MIGRVIDFGVQSDFLLALLPETILSLTAIAVLLGDVFQRGTDERNGGAWIGIVSLIGVLLAVGANVLIGTFDVQNPYSMIALDGFRIAVNFILLGVTALAILYSSDYLEREGLHIGEYYALLLLASVGMMIMVAGRDLIVLFLGLELMSIAIYVLVCLKRSDPRSSEAALKYFLIGAFASAFLLYGIALLYGTTGSTNLTLVSSEVARAAEAGSLLLFAGVGMLLIGFGFKVSAVPFHMWTPDAYEGAPTSVTGYMAAGVKVAAFAAVIRLFNVQLAPAESVWTSVLWWLAMLTMIVPNLIALAQDNVKRMLAYSSIAHAGYILVAVVAANELGRAAIVFYLAVYGLMTLGAFGIVYLVAGKGDSREFLSDYSGLGWSRPFLGVALVIFLLSLAGFPPTGGFVGKLFILRSALDAGQVTLAVTLALTSLVSYYYYLRVVWKMYFEELPDGVTLPARPGGAFRLAASLSAIGILLAGLLPGLAIRNIENATDDLGAEVSVPVTSADVGPTTTSGERSSAE
jgi:NADH-quinone oxidoreductase subunit N